MPVELFWPWPLWFIHQTLYLWPFLDGEFHQGAAERWRQQLWWVFCLALCQLLWHWIWLSWVGGRWCFRGRWARRTLCIFLFAKDFYFLPPHLLKVRGKLQSSCIRTKLKSHNCKLQPESDQLQCLLSPWSAHMEALSFLFPSSFLLLKLLTAAPLPQGLREGTENHGQFKQFNLQLLPTLRSQLPGEALGHLLPKVGAAQTSL